MNIPEHCFDKPSNAIDFCAAVVSEALATISRQFWSNLLTPSAKCIGARDQRVVVNSLFLLSSEESTSGAATDEISASTRFLMLLVVVSNICVHKNKLYVDNNNY
jgi:hypothetical protein